ncbi:MAG: AraC family transcriptional regulator [Sphingobacteriales bacterium]|nr:AraC family transcriptional regulator [Sphingobacteriales bacterium]MBI3720883.1 AraC family transcriptional regulator [Sphingobacteriales bacterium]
MKPALEHLPKEKDESFVVKYFDYHYYPTPWHYHPEMEIVLVTESTGKRFIGDHVSDFMPGNLAFLGPNIPHTYKNDDNYYADGSELRAKSIVIHFSPESLGNDFLKLPESYLLNKLFEEAVYGLEIKGKTNQVISNKLYDIVSMQGLKRWICLTEMLLDIATAKREAQKITHAPYIGYNEKESTRLCNVFSWVTANLSKEINLAEAAEVAQMNTNAFSRFFSLRTRKTFSGFLQEMRLQKAAKLLIETEMPVTKICFECGYNNISNFNRQFLNYYNMNPLKYKKTFSDNASISGKLVTS